MNLIQAWREVPNGDEITLLDEHGVEEVKVVKRGSFAGVVRQLTELICEADILSDRWRWRLK